MHPNGIVFLKVLLNKYALGGNEAALKQLPKEYAEALPKITTSSQDVSASLQWSHTIFSQVHYSWIVPLMQSLSPSLRQVMLGALPETSSAKLMKLLGMTEKASISSEKLKHYFLGMLYAKWNPQEAIPQQYLDVSELSPLLSLSKEKMIVLIDLLSMYDVAESIRHIVDKRILTSVFSLLSPAEQFFLRVCLHQRDKIKVTKLDIMKLKDKPQELRKTMHKRGMHRLGIALCGQSRQFLWHVTHILDTGRGGALAEQYADVPVVKVTPVLVQQTLGAIKFLHENKS